MLHNLNAGNLMILYFDFYYGKEDFVLAYADVRTVRNGIKVNRANVQRLWTEQHRHKKKTGTDRSGCRQQAGNRFFHLFFHSFTPSHTRKRLAAITKTMIVCQP